MADDHALTAQGTSYDDEEESSHDEESHLIEDDDDDDDDDSDSEETSLWCELLEGWRQHCCALAVAVAATLIAFYLQSLHEPEPILARQLNEPHQHLAGYQRTANLSFCGGVPDRKRHGLVEFDFDVPLDLIPALKVHYAADWIGDDSYQEARHSIDRVAHEQVACLETMPDNGRAIKGLTQYFRSPSIESMYTDHMKSKQVGVLQSSRKLQPAVLTFTGFAAKFVNLSPKPVLLYWDGRSEEQRRLVGEIAPFESLGTATTPGMSFSVSPVYDSRTALQRWTVTADDCLQYYEPEGVIDQLDEEQLLAYQMQKLNQEFARHYLIHSRRQWLANFPRPFPVFPMWLAESFGQVIRVDERYKLTVESVTPRVLSLRNFLSPEECDQLIALALSQGLKGSTVYSGAMAKHQQDRSTRSSSNAWLERSTTTLTDAIYRRAAKLLQMDESLLAGPIDDDVHEQHHSIVESLQVVRRAVFYRPSVLAWDFV